MASDPVLSIEKDLAGGVTFFEVLQTPPPLYATQRCRVSEIACGKM